MLLQGWRPEVSDKSLVLPLHHVQSLVQSLLPGEEHLVNADGASLVLVAAHHVVELDQLIPQSLLGLLENSSGVLNGISHVVEFDINFAGVARNLELFAAK